MATSIKATRAVATQLLLVGHKAFKAMSKVSWAHSNEEMCEPIRELLEKEGIKMVERLCRIYPIDSGKTPIRRAAIWETGSSRSRLLSPRISDVLLM